GISVCLSAIEAGLLNSKLTVHDFPMWLEEKPNQALKLPIVILEPESLKYWAKVIAGTGNIDTVGILFMSNWKELIPTHKLFSSQTTKDPELLVNKFNDSASLLARRLATLMSSAPVSIPVIHLIQEKMLPLPRKPIILAEIFMSGLLELKLISKNNQPEKWQYEFVEGVREVLWRSVRLTEIEAVLDAVSKYICQKAGISIKSFPALLFPDSGLDEKTKAEIFPFAYINQQVLRQGGDYAKLAEQLQPELKKDQVSVNEHEPPTSVEITNLPEIKTFEFEFATITITEDTNIKLQPFDFEVAKIEFKKLGRFKQKTELNINRQKKQAQHFTENLGDGIQLEMVAIPGGTFMMGSPENEKGYHSSQSPQHQVTVPPFFIGKYPVTQKQWRAVIDLKSDPSYFKGDNLPVESVSWNDAQEFCARLSRMANKTYRLPSEAEWEYACCGGTTTPFYCGETISTDLANYNGNYTYGDGSKGVYREETTEVGSFKIANEFGLYDMHGNVWEWCQDDWHNNYEGAPTDGSAWISNNTKSDKLLRGGSWLVIPEYCRSAYRSSNGAGFDNNYSGFRVVCDVRV
ncbi:MAG: SUMF1/EgtB/PvdO family nonheme iron enzyme, partial [Dolichospermum sp.]